MQLKAQKAAQSGAVICSRRWVYGRYTLSYVKKFIIIHGLTLFLSVFIRVPFPLMKEI